MAPRMMLLDLRMNLADDLPLHRDKTTLNHSVGVRVSMLEVELVRSIEVVLVYHQVRLCGGKLVHERLAEAVSRASIVRRRRKGFMSLQEDGSRRRRQYATCS